MSKDSVQDLRQLKQDYFKLLEDRRDERGFLLRAINAIASAASTNGKIKSNLKSVKKLLTDDGDLSLEQIDKEVNKLKDKIMAKEDPSDSDEPDRLLILEERILMACRMIKKLMASLLEDFYPMTERMKEDAKAIQITCKGDAAEIEIMKPTDELLDFLDDIKVKISEDFRDINRSFFILLDQVKELETSLASEFGGDAPLKEIEYFEMKINSEMGVIADSFNFYTTIKEAKKVVVEKLQNIRSLVSLKKKKETNRAEIAQKNIQNLKQRISDVEKDARQMSEKAEKFQEAAMKDGLTGLYNRKAFDIKIQDALKKFNANSNAFSIVVFDVDKFKGINDKLGHVAGDKVLQTVAACLEESFRKNDFIARYGGDEFVVVVEDLTEAMAAEKIARFKKNLKKRRFVSHKEGEIALSVSTGVSIATEGDTAVTTFERADKAMYECKQKNA
jgi:diguanylate cyclase (GGDEF)-like protein